MFTAVVPKPFPLGFGFRPARIFNAESDKTHQKRCVGKDTKQGSHKQHALQGNCTRQRQAGFVRKSFLLHDACLTAVKRGQYCPFFIIGGLPNEHKV
ncbi:MAG: hypothetical protein ACI4XB_00825 [Ruminococcus sp.]